ncbi:MAG TPA: serine hydroxymethyltransferase, partial [Candidatus Marinimicrobia bacterium]|nr:serine hydroxymethyltransferase [Candidatus Neomarinimicrobiota bacterium]
MSYLAQQDLDLFTILEKEINREESTLELIASENFTSPAVMEMAGGVKFS